MEIEHELSFTPKHEIITQKENEMKKAHKAKDIYSGIAWCEENKNKKEEADFEDNYNQAELAGMEILVAKIKAAPASQKWSPEAKNSFNEVLPKIRKIVENKLKTLDNEWVDAHKTGAKHKFAEIESEMTKYTILKQGMIEANKKIKQVK